MRDVAHRAAEISRKMGNFHALPFAGSSGKAAKPDKSALARLKLSRFCNHPVSDYDKRIADYTTLPETNL
jgi:hypothetical protein